MLRRGLLLAGVAVVLAGCAGESGLRAQALLQQAAAAQEQLASSSFEGRVAVKLDGQEMSLDFAGATSADGELFSMRTTGVPTAGDVLMRMLVRGERAWLDLGDGWQATPLPASARARGSMSAAAFQQLGRYVKDVRVTAHQLIDGKSMTTIGGEIDTAGLLTAFTEMAGFAGKSFDLSALGVSFGDIHTVLTIDERTHLLVSAFVDFAVDADGKHAEIAIHYRLTGVNEPVELPSP
jgi:hypothetical protein